MKPFNLAPTAGYERDIERLEDYFVEHVVLFEIRDQQVLLLAARAQREEDYR